MQSNRYRLANHLRDAFNLFFLAEDSLDFSAAVEFRGVISLLLYFALM